MTAGQLNVKLCFEPAEGSKKAHTELDTNRKAEKICIESSEENLVLKFYVEPKSLM